MQRFELAFLSTTIGAAPKAAPGDRGLGARGQGQAPAVWASEIGLLNQILVLRAFEGDADLAAERARAIASPSPFGCGRMADRPVDGQLCPLPLHPAGAGGG